MPGPVLLVHDDIAVIAAARRLLSREGLEVMLATSVADALIAFGHHQPSLLVVAPAVESDRGATLLDELRRHPDGTQARFVLLGDGVPGVAAPVVPLPLDGALFLDAVRRVLRNPDEHHPWQKIALPSVAPVAGTKAAPLEAMLFGEGASGVRRQSTAAPLLSPEPVTPVNAIAVPAEARVAKGPVEGKDLPPILGAEPTTPVPAPGGGFEAEESFDLLSGVPGAPAVPQVAPARVTEVPLLSAEPKTPVPSADPTPRVAAAERAEPTAHAPPPELPSLTLAPVLDAEPRTPVPRGEPLPPVLGAEPRTPVPTGDVEAPGAADASGAAGVQPSAAPRLVSRVLSHLPHLDPLPGAGPLTAELLPALLASVAELPHTTALVLASVTSQRTLWIEGERIVAIQSRQASESLLDQARRDGLIDARQESQLQPLRFAPPSAVLAALMERGLVREKEADPLLERYVDGTATAALSEPESSFELRRDDPLPVSGVVKSRPLPPILLAALRQHESVPGVSAATRVAPLWPLESSEAFGPVDRERRLLRQLDTELSVAELAQRAGRPVDWVARTVGSWVRLGWVELRAPGPEAAMDPHPQVSIARLSAKLAASDESDYFSILELPRQVTAQQVQEAFQQLAQEFDPARFGTHPDPAIRSRAQHLHSLLEEAASVLSDDRLRGEYARNLLD